MANFGIGDRLETAIGEIGSRAWVDAAKTEGTGMLDNG